ncbi:MAG: phosphonate C-P lyase system protein PhnG [Pseudomonadota bacterium]
MSNPETEPAEPIRGRCLSILAKSPPNALEALVARFATRNDASVAEASWLRQPEVGMVMVQGRMGGDGQPFNLGEMTVTRCALRLGDGTVGHGYTFGRRPAHAELIARLDAALQQEDHRGPLAAEVLGPLNRSVASAAERRSAKSNATKVDFFTLVRGEN